MKKVWLLLTNNPFFNAIKNIKTILDSDQKKRTIIMLFLLLLNAIFDVLGLTAIYPLIDAALNPSTIQTKQYLKIPYDLIGVQDTVTFLFILSSIVFLVFLLKNAISLLIFYIQSKFAFNISLRLSKKMFQHYYEQGYLYINNEDSGTKTYNVINIPFLFANTYIIETLILSTEIVVLLIIFLIVMYIAPLAIIVLLFVIIPVFLLVYQFTKNRAQYIGEKRNELYPQCYATVLDSMAAYTDVKLSNKEQHFLNTYSNLQKSVNHLDALYNGIYKKVHQRMNDVVLGLGLMVVFFIALIFKENSEKIISILSVFALAAYRFLPSINRIMAAALSIKNSSYLIPTLKIVTNKALYTFKHVETLAIKDSIKFENLSYKYPSTENNVLNRLSFEVKKGETIGFIGTSGSGKTTLLNVLLRFLHETEGKIYIDGIALQKDNSASFQKAIGYVRQNVYIKNSTLEENIAFSKTEEEIDYQLLNKVIKDAMLFDFVDNHPDGIKMQLGENGINLSGGQRQRIGIARALYKNAQILVFDEATSALDSETEKEIVSTINHLTKLNKTIFIVAHRITTLEKCDRIYELENGTIKQFYSYKELFEEKILSNKI